MMYAKYIFVIICVSVTVEGYFWIEEGGNCQTGHKEKGTCTHFTKCLSAIEEVRRNGRPKICSFAGIYPIVCCSSSSNFVFDDNQPQAQTPNKKVSYYLPFDERSISQKKCRDYYRGIRDDSSKYSRRDSKIKQYAYVALLGFQKYDQVIWSCAGALISEKFVLMAAHCLHSRVYGNLKYIRLGELDAKYADDDSQPQDFTIKKVYEHPNYEPSSGYYDIALLELNKPARFTDYVKPACLAVTENLNGTIPELTGFGLFDDEVSYKKLETDYYEYVQHEHCDRVFGKEAFIKNGITDSQICAKAKTACQVHSGGPLQFTNFFYEFGNFPEIIGISSFGKQCGKQPDVFTRVYSYILWIERIVWSS